MRILYISYWSLNEGLSRATVVPHLEVLNAFEKVDRIFLSSMERDRVKNYQILPSKVTHLPFYTGTAIWNKFLDFLTLPQSLVKTVKHHNIDFIICRGAPAGSLGYLVYWQTKTPYAVESFEPHATYMKESGVWNSLGLKYWIQQFWENKQKQTANFLLPVSNSYKNYLIRDGIVKNKLIVVPCTVDTHLFSFSEIKRREIRQQWGVTDNVVVGVYVGKFGGLYEEHGAYRLFNLARERFKSYFQLILTPDKSEVVCSELLKMGFSKKEFFVAKVSYEQIPSYLSASDFAFATYKNLSSSKYLSPIKIGEYWATGLPVLLTQGVGDDSLIIDENRQAGSLFNLAKTETIMEAFQNMEDQFRNTTRVQRFQILSELTKKYRNLSTVEESYKILLSTLSERKK